MSKINIMSLLLVSAVVLFCSQTVLAEEPIPTAGNCLSTPVIWSDGVIKALRGVYGSPQFDGASDYSPVVDGIGAEVWLQKDFLNAWQAENLAATAPVDVTWIDWGDNLEAVDWSEKSKVRVEVVLWQDITAATMVGFEMGWVSGLGTDEVWGTSAEVYDSVEATVYSGCANLTIQKLTDGTQGLTWNPDTNQWDGDALTPQFNGGVWAGIDGPGYYSAEINVSGKCMYGYNWDVKAGDEGAGSYRLTFSLVEDIDGPVLNTFFTEDVTTIMLPEEEPEEPEAVVMLEEGDDTGEPEMGGVAVLRCDLNLTYIDLNITEKVSGGGGGGGNNPN